MGAELALSERDWRARVIGWKPLERPVGSVVSNERINKVLSAACA